MAEFSLDRFKYRWRGDWTASASYRRDDIVRVNGKSYVCLIAHTSSSAFRSDLNAILPGSSPPQPQPKWVVMTSGRSFLGNWTSAIDYNLGDVVLYQGSLYICKVSHNSSSFVTDFDNWTLYALHFDYLGNWSATTDYAPGAVVKYNGLIYKCIVQHTSTSLLEDNIADWQIFYEGLQYRGPWTPDTEYRLNDRVKFGGTIFVCTQTHTSTAEFNDILFTIEFPGYQHEGEWTNTTLYNVGDIVRYGGYLYYANVSNTDSQPTLDDSTDYWTLMSKTYNFRASRIVRKTVTVGLDTINGQNAGKFYIDGVENPQFTFSRSSTYIFDQSDSSNSEYSLSGAPLYHPLMFSTVSNGELDGGTTYNTGVTYKLDGNIVTSAVYIENFQSATTRTVEITVSTSAPDRLFYYCHFHRNLGNQIDVRGGIQHDLSTAYRPGDIILRGGRLYQALVDVNESDGQDSTESYLDTSIWELLVPGQFWSSQWQASRNYSVGEVVNYLGTAYICNFEHNSSNINFPGDNGNGFDYWDILIQEGQPGGMLAKGDLLTYGLNRENVGDGSTLGPLRVPIGTQNQKLSVSAELEVFWRDVTNDADVIYVTNNGSDVTGNGSKYSPFKSIKHACEYVEDNVQPLTPMKVHVSTGRFEEIGPIIMPAGCMVMGDELRSTSIVANSPIPAYENHFQYVTEYLDYFETFLFNLITNVAVTTGYTGGAGQDRSLPASNVEGSNTITALLSDFKNYIEFRIDSGSTDPTVTGSNEVRFNEAIRNAGAILNANKVLIYNEIIGYLQANYPGITFNTDNIRMDVYSLIRGLKRDIEFSGNYGTINFAARRFVNAVLGSQQDDMFYCRDTTGLRNCTVSGLQGTLNPPGVFDLYQRPTGGAYCSLDPGWGPADERTWIVNRSPYIQGVTTLGYGAVGQKIDGALHNGGNKSMVSNDFTQVISDGIGAWVLNNARAELVSVFTYYAQVGYLAEDGGVIRATNGNNSYGSFGAIADGNDETETPQAVSVWNRANEASVVEAFAGGNNDHIFAFEYGHCGENYTQANADIVGAGADASVDFTDFRDGALFQARLINTSGSGEAGGSNYLVRQNSAQLTSGASTRIILNVNEDTQDEAEILGMRILIVSGDGSGQYGIVDGFDLVTKSCDVIKESDGTAGWDHVVPGTPIETALDSTAVYRIEPRLEANHPGFTSTLRNLPSSRTYADADFGGITETFNSITLDTGSGETFDESAVAAVVTVVQNSGVYTVTLTNPGAGYAVGDALTILGTSLGGSSPINDLTITVTSTSNDSTNSIQSFTQSGVGREGRIVAVAGPNYAQYSDDGQNWSEVNLPFSGTFVKVLNGNGNFVVVPDNDNKIAWSADGTSWTTRGLPVTETWVDGVFGGGKFVLLANSTSGNTAVYSTNGLSWNTSVLPVGSDSTVDEYQAIAHGAGKFVAITGSQTKDVAVSNDGINWTLETNVLPAGGYEWAGLAFGNNRFLALATDGSTAYSLDHGATWYQGTSAPNGTSADLTWIDIKFSQGVFFVTAEDDAGGSTYCATTEDGLYWYERTLESSGVNKVMVFSNFSNVGRWHLFANSTTTNGLNEVYTGAQAKLRADVFQGAFSNVKIWDPGSGYDSVSNPVTITVTDNQFVAEVETENRIGVGVLAQPDFIDRGTGYRTSTSTITITGDGYADIIPESNTVVLKGVSVIPGPGAQIRFNTIPDEETEDPDDTLLFTGVGVEDLGEDDSGTGTRLVRFTLSPRLRNEYNLEHATLATIRTRFSQCRITGHDFLDIGTGNFVETNYPELYAGGAFFVAAPEDEVLEVNGGRVFYTSTDQDGNFRAGELFKVDQATGIVTISAEFFDLDGLSELSLGGVRLGGSGAVVNEFSTDQTFAADSNNIIPTQRAIAAFLADRLSVGGSDLEVGGIQAGQVLVGTPDNVIDNAGGGYVQIPVGVDFITFDDNGNACGIQGTVISQMLYFRNVNDTIQ